MLYDFSGVKVEVKNTTPPKYMDVAIAAFEKKQSGITLVWKDDVEDIKMCEHCDEAWDIDTVFADFDYMDASAKGFRFTYRMSEAELEKDPYWHVKVCPVCAERFKASGLKEKQWWER